MSESSPIRRRGLFTSEVFEKALSTLDQLLTASKIERAPRGPDGGHNYAEVPDNTVRLQAVKLVIELETGRAPQSLEITMPNAGAKIPTSDDAAAILAANPDLLNRLLSETVINNMKRAQKAGRLQDVIEMPKN
jgi:hypothetical protein